MGSKIQAKLKTKFPDMTAKEIEIWTLVSEGIIEELIASAEVLPGTFSTAQGPVTGKGKIS